MKNIKIKEATGITLVALVVTIVVLVILAGVSISLVLSQYGIIGRAQVAGETQRNAQNLEEQYLQNADLYINEQIAAGGVGGAGGTTIVAGQTATGENKTYNDGTDTAIIPKGFTVSGLSDENKIANGLVIYDLGETDTSSWNSAYWTANKATIQSTYNQFVWVPCTSTEYKKCKTWNGITQSNGTLANASWDETTPTAEATKVNKYGGFYVARYEAGLASTITEFTTNQKHTGSNDVYDKAGVPQSKAGKVPWMFINWTNSKANAESMYNNNSNYNVESALITGTQWDVILNKMLSKGKVTVAELIDSENWGNYRNKELTYTGRLALADKGTTNSGYWTLKPFATTVTTNGTKEVYAANNGALLTTGASTTTQRYNIYDIAGNVWEWTNEQSGAGTDCRVHRGGSYIDASSDCPACYRGHNTVSHAGLVVGFRAILYIK